MSDFRIAVQMLKTVCTCHVSCGPIIFISDVCTCYMYVLCFMKLVYVKLFPWIPAIIEIRFGIWKFCTAMFIAEGLSVVRC